MRNKIPVAMKKTIIIICSVLLLTYSCSQSDSYKTLKMAEQLMEEHTDSAWNILSGIDTTQLKQGEERALYNLLSVQSQYKLYLPIKSDSLLEYSEDYYNRHGCDYYIANTHYYRGAVLADIGEIAKSAQYLKKAEIYSQIAKHELLKNKVYELLVNVNERASNFILALKYNKKFLESSILLNDSNLICRAYDGVSFVFDKLGQNDSSRFYRAKCNELLPKAKTMIYRFYANDASGLIQEHKYLEAKRLLLKADSIEHTAYQYNMLAEIALFEGDTIQANNYLEKVLRFGLFAESIQAYKKRARLCCRLNQYKEAYRLLSVSDSLTHVYNERVRPISIAMYQQDFDLTQADLEATRQQNRLLITLLVVVILMSSGIIFYLIKVRKLKTVVSKKVTALNEAQNEVERLRLSDENHEKEICQLNTRIQRLSEETAARLGKGKELYEQAMRREPLIHFSGPNEQCLIDYYAYTHAQRFANLLLPYQAPTRRLVTYLLLSDMGLTDKDIQQVLNVSSNTVRSYRHRLSCTK
jgi:cell division protein FtsL/uncharacterized protein YcfL